MQVAIVGGSGGLGQHIADEFVKHKKYKLILLSRKELEQYSDEGADIRIVDFNSVSSLKHALQGVHTVISCIASRDPVTELTVSKNIIEACEEAGVKRFIPSEWGPDLEKYGHIDFEYFEAKQQVREVLAKSKLEYTLIANGIFMDYLLPKMAKKHLRDLPLPIDVQKATAKIPGTGDVPVTFTLADNVAEAVVELVGDPVWEKHTHINGETTTLNKILHTAEEVTGKKFTVTYVPREQVLDAQAHATDRMSRALVGVDLWYVEGYMALHKAHQFKTVKFVTVEELLRQTYKK